MITDLETTKPTTLPSSHNLWVAMTLYTDNYCLAMARLLSAFKISQTTELSQGVSHRSNVLPNNTQMHKVRPTVLNVYFKFGVK